MDDLTARHIEESERRLWGKYRGVVRDRDDPDQLGRLRVSVPSVLGDEVTGWAWPVSAYAGVDAGIVFLPQLGDVVWVEFVEGDLDEPVWTGGAWAKPGGRSELPAEALVDYPDRAVVKTRAGHVLEFSDVGGKERVVIRLRDGARICLNAADDSVTVSASTVTLHASTVVVENGGTAQRLATESFVTTVFNTHTHATGTGPSGPPVPLSTTQPLALTSVASAQ
jgi:uncharacterized protein involved in type VI secretion and phage assembly